MAKIFKFGGASIKDAASFQNVGRIVSRYKSKGLVLVVSALGKTTNALERVVNAYYANDDEAAFGALDEVRQAHNVIIGELFPSGHAILEQEINDLFVDIEWVIEEELRPEYNYAYDQIVSVGELLSTKILAALLQTHYALPVAWLDARDCVRTDNRFRQAQVDWVVTEAAIRKKIANLSPDQIALTQGFIGSTDENFTTTLGREGSDYTAAIFAYCLDAQSLTIWKDVPGVLTADPRLFPDRAQLLPEISYEEAIEMTYYGAQVIHPNTLRPLQNKEIPLFVKSFVEPEAAGTTVGAASPAHYPPIIVLKPNQVLLRIKSRAFHFIDEARFAELFGQLAAQHLKANMIQNTALAFSIAVDFAEQPLERFIAHIEPLYHVERVDGLQLLTLRYADAALLDHFSQGRSLLLSAHIGQTSQLLGN